MEEIQYIGEHLWPGRLGHFAILTSFVAGLLACYAYFQATQKRHTEAAHGWQMIGRGAFLTHGLAVFSTIGLIFFIMFRQYYEYNYVWAHVSPDLPKAYIFAAFWEGQEGSFLLWMFWHVVLGLILILRGKRWEAPTLSVLASIQFILASMLLGIYFGGGEGAFKLGSNPLLLLRDTMDAPIFAKADYLELIQGNGLNPLLQNYWNTIHPPVLFLGFASTAIPFTFAIAGLWTKEHKAWLKPALSWALFSGAILGIGILMGGAWAYEALSFGGYWAWDPVENMSLVPWLILVAGIHTNLIAKATGYSIRSTYIFYLITFVLVVYSTFLTRSGVLGETSVHAFTEMGLEWQLIGFLATYLLLSIVLTAVRYRGIPSPEKEEGTASREFWMFIGTLVLLFSAVIITASTSLPVYNKIVQFFNPAFEGRVITDPVPHYNKYQLWIAVFIGLLSGLTQYLRFREPNWSKNRRKFLLHTGAALAISALLTVLATLWINAKAWQYLVLLFTGIFTLVCNFDYILFYLKGNLKQAGSAFSHIGFGLMIVGIMASGLNKQFISQNTFIMEGLIEGADEEQLARNILLFKDSPMAMSGYEVTYVKDTLDLYTRTYTLNFKRRNAEGKVVEEFHLYPNILYEKSFEKIAASNPSTKRYLHKDIFTHIASLPQVEMDMQYRQAREDSLNYRYFELKPDQMVTFVDTVELQNLNTTTRRTYFLNLKSIDRQPTHPDYRPEEGDLAIGATIEVTRSDDDSVFVAQPVLVLRGQLLYSYPVQLNPLNTKIKLNQEVFSKLFTFEEDLDYREFNLRPGETASLDDLTIMFAGYNRNPANDTYTPREGDLPVGARLQVNDPSGKSYLAQPIFLIRDQQPMNLKDVVEELGLHTRFAMVDPQTEAIQLLLARETPREPVVPIEIATDSLRSDYIVLEAIEFPGINFFWLGSLLMMLGLGFSMYVRITGRKVTAHA